MSAGMVVFTPLDAELPEGPQRAGDGGRAVGPPANQLAGQIVVELADLIARLVAAVPPGAVAPRAGSER